MITKKLCSTCNESKPCAEEHFYCYDGKFLNNCKPCRQQIEKNRRRVAGIPARVDPRLLKERTCTTCHHSFPNTNEFFHLKSDKRYGSYLSSKCKGCTNEYGRKRLEDQRRAVGIASRSEIRLAETRACKTCQKTFPNTGEFFYARHDKRRGYTALDRDCLNCKRHREKIAAQKKRAELPDYIPQAERMAARRTPTKCCTRCEEEKLNTEEFFAIGLTGVTESRCRDCKNEVAQLANREREKNDPLYKLRKKLMKHLKRGIEMFGKTKTSKTMEIIGYTTQDLYEHLDTQLLPGMTWKNHGRKWHIDHIRPVASFCPDDYADIEDMMRDAFALSNLQPLWDSENVKKASIWDSQRWYLGKGYPLSQRLPVLECSE